jgi:signal peptidase I
VTDFFDDAEPTGFDQVYVDRSPGGPLAAEPPPAVGPRHTSGNGGKKGRSSDRDKVRSIVEWVAVVVGALVVALVVKTFLFQAFYIPSASMEPTLQKGDRVLVNKLSYDLHDVHRGDVIVFELPPEKVGPDGIKDLIKRVVGLPGDVIESRDGDVYIDGKLLKEPYLPDGVTTDHPPIEKQTVPEGHVFVLGDNRDNSADSRFENRGPIPIDTIIGRAFIQVWPPTDIGGL